MPKIFVSWSQTQGQRLAEALKEIVLDLQNLDVWVSSQNIGLGSDWFNSLNEALKEADGGLVCVTRDALSSPWVNFEIGALWARLNNVKFLLFGVDKVELNNSPLSQIQLSQGTSKEDVTRVLYEFFKPEDKDLIDRHLTRTWEEWIRIVEAIMSPLEEETGADANVLSLSRALDAAFEAQSRKFKVFDFKLHSTVSRAELERRELPFDLVKNGFLKMRSDTPKLVRTAYDASLLFKVVPEVLTMSHVEQVLSGAEQLLNFGIDTGKDGHFEPWDTYVFLVGLDFDEAIKSISHRGYINLFLLTFDGRHLNPSPHEWMNDVIRQIYLQWKPQTSGMPNTD